MKNRQPTISQMAGHTAEDSMAIPSILTHTGLKFFAGAYNSDTERKLYEMRANVLPIIEKYGVDLVLTGHSHTYERSAK